MKCFYHNDLDGRCAGAIVFHSVGIKPKKGNHKLEMIEIDYKDTIDVGKIKKNEQFPDNFGRMVFHVLDSSGVV